MRKRQKLPGLDVFPPRTRRDVVADRIAEGPPPTSSESAGGLVRSDAVQRARNRLEALALEGLRSGPPIPVDNRYFERMRARISRQAGSRQDSKRAPKRPV